MGEPIEVETQVTVNFALSGRKIMDAPLAGTPEALGGKLPDKGRIVPGTLVRQVTPNYPDDAKRTNLSGTVTLRLVVDKKGNVKEAKAMGGDPVFFDSAIAAAKQWKYSPFTVNGRPIDAVTVVTLRYSRKPEEGTQPQ